MIGRHTIGRSLALGGLVALGALNAWATSFVPLSLDARIARADLVVVAQVSARQAQWDDGRIVTFAHLDVEELWRGTLSASEGDGVLIGVPGGFVGDLGQHVADAPQLEAGQRAVFLLGPATGPGGARRVVQLNRGVLAIDGDAVDADGPQRLDALRHAYAAAPPMAPTVSPGPVTVTP